MLCLSIRKTLDTNDCVFKRIDRAVVEKKYFGVDKSSFVYPNDNVISYYSYIIGNRLLFYIIDTSYYT